MILYALPTDTSNDMCDSVLLGIVFMETERLQLEKMNMTNHTWSNQFWLDNQITLLWGIITDTVLTACGKCFMMSSSTTILFICKNKEPDFMTVSRTLIHYTVRAVYFYL